MTIHILGLTVLTSVFPGLKGVQSRAQSESSGEFSLSLENEPWSNGSSPVQQPPSRHFSPCYHPPSDTSTPQQMHKQQHKEKAPNLPVATVQSHPSVPKQKDSGASQEFWLTRGTKSIRRGSRGKVIRRSSDSCGIVKMNPGLNNVDSKSSCSKAETTRASACSPITVLYVQGKSSSVSGCLNCFSTPLGKEGRLKGSRSPKSLPRASSVISTAEGSSRRSSINSDCRVAVTADSVQSQVSEECNRQEEAANQNEQQGPNVKDCECEPIPPVKPPRDPAVAVATDQTKSPVQESLLGSSFTFTSVFSDTIFSDSMVSAVTHLEGLDNSQTFVCVNPSSLESQEPRSEAEKGQSRDGLEKQEPVTTA